MGLSMIVWLFSSAIQLGRRGLQKSKAAQEVSALFLAGIGALFVHSLFVNSLFYPWVLVWVTIMLGVMERTVMADR